MNKLSYVKSNVTEEESRNLYNIALDKGLTIYINEFIKFTKRDDL